MKKLLIGLAALGLMSSAFTSGNAAGKTVYKVSPGSSKVKWVGTKVTGKHDGKIKVKKGTMVFEGTEWVGGEFVIDMTSITVSDIKNPENNKKLEGHLKNADFFATNKYKTATLKIKDVKFGKGGKYDVFGDLTIKGKTKPVSFRADVTQKDNSVTARGKITLDRTDFGVKYKSGKFFKALGDKLIHDKFTLDVKLRAKK
jgi:polyisoprenoid-binding protein YceI